MAGVTQKAIMELMGHKAPKMSLRYTHISLDYKRAAVAQLEHFGTGVTTFFTTPVPAPNAPAP